MSLRHVRTFLSFLIILIAAACSPAPALDPPAALSSPTVLPTYTATAAVTVTPTNEPTAAPTPTGTAVPAAYKYLQDALDILQQYSVRRDQVDWARLRAGAWARARGAQVPADTYDAIRYAIEQLGDHHSKFYTPDQAALLRQLKVADNKPPQFKVGTDHLAYFLLPGFVTFDDAQRHLYANRLQSLIREADGQRPCGWILDLRQNTGGNIWPMLAGVGPLAGDGTLGAFVYPGGEKQEWIYRQGQALLADHLLEQVDGGGYHLAHAGPPVAVLTGPKTQSAGEAVAIAFRGRPGSKSFGQPTGGLSTANGTYDLSDGAAIVLTIVTDMDRTGRIYGGPLQPDQLVPANSASGDTALKVASDWLHAQPACAVQ